MIDTPNLLTNARRFVALHAERLGVSLVQLREQLREAIAQRVATAVAEAVQSVTKRVLGDGPTDRLPLQPAWAGNGHQRLWEDPRDAHSRQGRQGLSHQFDEHEEDGWLEDVSPPESGSQTLGKQRLPRTLFATLALAAFCGMLSWLGFDGLAKSVKELSALTNVLGAGTGLLIA